MLLLSCGTHPRNFREAVGLYQLAKSKAVKFLDSWRVEKNTLNQIIICRRDATNTIVAWIRLKRWFSFSSWNIRAQYRLTPEKWCEVPADIGLKETKDMLDKNLVKLGYFLS